MPRKPSVSPQDIAHYAEWMCTQEEIAQCLGVNQSTISRLLEKPEYQRVYETARAQTKYKLRRTQIESALAGKTVDGIWAGKQYLDQRDSPQTMEQNVNVEIRYVAEWGGGGALPAPAEQDTIEGEVEEET